VYSLIGVHKNRGEGNAILERGGWEQCLGAAERLFGSEVVVEIRGRFGEFVTLAGHEKFTAVRVISG
jgi:hypothetical protein